MFKKEVDIALLVIFFILFLSLGFYIGFKDQNGERFINLENLKFWSSEEQVSPQPEVISEEKEPITEMPSSVYDLFLNNTAVIEIKDTKYFPDELDITAGTNVTWKNIDPVRTYQVYERATEQKFNSFRLGSGESYSYVFNEPGVYYFSDAVFAYMKGIIRVTKG